MDEPSFRSGTSTASRYSSLSTAPSAPPSGARTFFSLLIALPPTETLDPSGSTSPEMPQMGTAQIPAILSMQRRQPCLRSYQARSGYSSSPPAAESPRQARVQGRPWLWDLLACRPLPEPPVLDSLSSATVTGGTCL